MFVVTLPKAHEKRPEIFAAKAEIAGTDVLEVRGDLTPDVQAFATALRLLLAPRGTGDRLLQHLAPSFIDIDVEEDENVVRLPANVPVIWSYHNYEQTPETNILFDMASHIADAGRIIKISTKCNGIEDVQRLLLLQQMICSQYGNFKHIILGMGTEAKELRLQSPFRNKLTYARLDDEPESAEGQLPLRLYREMIQTLPQEPPTLSNR